MPLYGINCEQREVTSILPTHLYVIPGAHPTDWSRRGADVKGHLVCLRAVPTVYNSGLSTACATLSFHVPLF